MGFISSYSYCQPGRGESGNTFSPTSFVVVLIFIVGEEVRALFVIIVQEALITMNHKKV
jgi:hypothetical protein